MLRYGSVILLVLLFPCMLLGQCNKAPQIRGIGLSTALLWPGEYDQVMSHGVIVDLGNLSEKAYLMTDLS